MGRGYALAYRLGVTPWEQAGERASESMARLLDREEQDRDGRPGRAVDLGCGRGQHAHELARRGWEVVGVDAQERAVEAARATGGGARFVVGDVTRLAELGIGPADLFLDVGCFHGLDAGGRQAEAEAISAAAVPGATVILLAFRPHHLPLLPSGATQGDVEQAFARWDLLAVEPADTTGMPAPLRRTAPHWYRLGLRDAAA